MKTKPTTHGSPWTRINAVEKDLVEQIRALTSHMHALDQRVAKLEKPPKKTTRKAPKVKTNA